MKVIFLLGTKKCPESNQVQAINKLLSIYLNSLTNISHWNNTNRPKQVAYKSVQSGYMLICIFYKQIIIMIIIII